MLGVRDLTPGIEFRGGSEFRVPQVADTSEIDGAGRGPLRRPGHSRPGSRSWATDSVRVQTERLTEPQTDQVRTALATAYGAGGEHHVLVRRAELGPRTCPTRRCRAWWSSWCWSPGVIALYFRTWKMAAAALIALLHDLMLTVGVYALIGFEVTPASVIGFLTILGYSLYDTVVVFDKVRENTEHITASTKRTFDEAANLAVNQTLVRSINTSVVALLPVASILFIGAFLLGAGTLKDISLALFVGIAAGHLLVDLHRHAAAVRPAPARAANCSPRSERVLRRRREEAERRPALVGAEAVVAGGRPRGRIGPAGSGRAGSGPAGSGPAGSGPPDRAQPDRAQPDQARSTPSEPNRPGRRRSSRGRGSAGSHAGRPGGRGRRHGSAGERAGSSGGCWT